MDLGGDAEAVCRVDERRGGLYSLPLLKDTSLVAKITKANQLLKLIVKRPCVHCRESTMVLLTVKVIYSSSLPPVIVGLMRKMPCAEFMELTRV